MNTQTPASRFPMPEKPQIEPNVEAHMPSRLQNFVYGVACIASLAVLIALFVNTERPSSWNPILNAIGYIPFVSLIMGICVSGVFSIWLMWSVINPQIERQDAEKKAIEEAEKKARELWAERIAETKRKNLENEYAHLLDGDRLVKIRDAMKAWEDLGRPGW